MKVTVVGAGKYGSTTAQRIAEKDLCDEVVMTDIVEGLPQGLALDMLQSRPIEHFEAKSRLLPLTLPLQLWLPQKSRQLRSWGLMAVS